MSFFKLLEILSSNLKFLEFLPSSLGKNLETNPADTIVTPWDFNFTMKK